MSALHIEDRPYWEVLSVRTTIGSLARMTVLEADGSSSDYWNANELAPPLARELAAATAATLKARFTLSPGSLRIMFRTRPSRRVETRLDSEAVLLFSPAYEDAGIDLIRRAAAMLISGLQHPNMQSANSPQVAMLVPAAPANVLLESPLGALLGTKIQRDLTAEVPGHPVCAFTGSFALAPRHSLKEETIHVRGRISSAKTSGRSRTVGIEGRIEGLAGEEFRQPRVLFSEDLLPMVANAVREPWRALSFTLVRSSVPTGKAKSRFTYSLKALSLVAS